MTGGDMSIAQRWTAEDLRWTKMTPVKKYKYHTLFARRNRHGDVIFECFLNTEIEMYKKGHKTKGV